MKTKEEILKECHEQFNHLIPYPTVSGDVLKASKAAMQVYADQETQKLRSLCEKLAGALDESNLQIEYLHNKFKKTGSGNAVIAKNNSALNEYEQTFKPKPNEPTKTGA